MKITREEIRNRLKEKGLKVTPQREAILEAVYVLNNHPSAENIIAYIRETHPNIASGTVYKVLDTYVTNGLIRRVTNDRDIMRYDGIVESHHHLYCMECQVIEDYQDAELDKLLRTYFKNRNIEGFEIREFVLQINGVFNKC